MRVLVIDGQGGGLGRQLVTAITALCPEVELTAVGTNSLGCLRPCSRRAPPARPPARTPWWSTARRADVIVGPIGIVIADALLGEITPGDGGGRLPERMPSGCSSPSTTAKTIVVGVPEQPVSQLVSAAAQKVKALCEGKVC